MKCLSLIISFVILLNIFPRIAFSGSEGKCVGYLDWYEVAEGGKQCGSCYDKVEQRLLGMCFNLQGNGCTEANNNTRRVTTYIEVPHSALYSSLCNAAVVGAVAAGCAGCASACAFFWEASPICGPICAGICSGVIGSGLVCWRSSLCDLDYCLANPSTSDTPLWGCES